ncbi:S-(hydroxymethyl)glutathione synthase [Sphingomonas sp. BIUV-7]|uniref:Glutathione-dependent formaldehyde-activating enzyme n=1 Tax=Sphingomonas natans TaxID=3063330 RepID=A0ABT8YAF3_9SPHN|nr:S-(hydroxymethyl)glutathione synthase [Sphingomonas sp. BIUV-7]MDO6415295.1 S-(hydroxymethyl)glutathione synthase [Sphingomonas sp. BIUV-7]
MTIALHPALDADLSFHPTAFTGGALSCHCQADPVRVTIDSAIAHNHACGCTKCWKPQGAVFAVIGVVPRDGVTVVAGQEKLTIVDQKMTIQRHACRACGVHMYGRIEDPSHAFFGLDFVHAELLDGSEVPPPGFAAFVSSIIEGGVDPGEMNAVREQIRRLGLEPYDCLDPVLMDTLATHAFRQRHAA